MIVVSDTSPIRGLANLGLRELLREIYQEVIIPAAVAAELATPPRGQAAVDLAAFPFVQVRVSSMSLELHVLLGELDRGEAEALILAQELKAGLILIDEAAGREKAKQLGLDTIGVLGVLLEAKHRGSIEAVTPLLDRLKDNHRFFIGPGLRDKVLRLAGEIQGD